jgi:peroxiredoxin
MKLRYIIAVLMMGIATSAQAAEVGKPAPAFAAKDINGAEQSIAQYAGKIVVLEWNNPGCPFVKKHYESDNMQKLQQYAKDKGVVWFTINSGAEGKQGHMNAEQAKEYVSKVSAQPAAYILDREGKIGHLYEAKTTPHMFVIDASGNLAYNGAIDDKSSTDKDDIKTAKNYVRVAIDSLLAGKKVETAQTQAYGCSVKY